MFDSTEDRDACEDYLRGCLGGAVQFVRATELSKSTRLAPWKVEVMLDGAARSFVMQVDVRGMEYEYRVLEAMAGVGIPVPHVYGLDLRGDALGFPCSVSDFIAGDSLLKPMLNGERWAESLYFDAISALHAVTEADLAPLQVERVGVDDVLEASASYFELNPHPLAEAMQRRLEETRPDLPPVRFSNGDLWLENFIVQDRELAAVIDFQHAAFSDPIFEFLLSFFVEPALRGRGIEERFCRRLGHDPAVLNWYHGLELLDTWRAVLKQKEPFVHHTAATLETDVAKWLGTID